MTAIETTAQLEDASHLKLARPLPASAKATPRVIVMVPDNDLTTVSAPDFQSALGSYYREHPDEPRRSSDEWLRELREGEI